MAELKLTYGKDSNGRLVHVDEVQRGLACECVCPGCGAQLVARKGERKQHHFAHANGADCAGARMTALHMLAQQILEKEKQVMLPNYSNGREQHACKCQSFKTITLEEVCKDETSRRRPDCIGRPFKNDKSLWIEIFCCNPISKEREDDIKRRKQYCIEINLSDLLNTQFTEEDVKKRLLTNREDRKWVCHPEWDERARIVKADENDERLQEEHVRDEYKKEEMRKQEELEQSQESLFANGYNSYSPKNKTLKISQNRARRDWVMYAKNIYNDEDALTSFYNLLSTEYRNVTLENSNPMVQEELYSKTNQLLPRIKDIADVNKRYLVLLLTIWVLDRLNHNKAFDLGKLFIENKNLRNEIFRTIKGIGNIDKRPIEGMLHSAEMENRDIIFRILQICYTQ